jgi:hypothetical protein
MVESIHQLLQINRIYVFSALLATVVMLTAFKLIYPYPNMVLDSYYYIMAAISHADVNAWAIGYSWFLRFFGLFSHSPLLLVIFQYLFLEASLLIFFLTLTNIFNLSKLTKWILFAFFFTNPLLLFCSNFVMADSLFIALSALWISLLLWMVFKPRPYMLWVHAILIILVFTVRYNALYYPFVATLAFMLSPYRLGQKLLGIGLQVLLIGGFILYTSIRVGALSGQRQFSPFGNWKTANDALYMYGHIYQESSEVVPVKFAILHRGVKRYFQSGARVDDLLDYQSPFYGSIYMFFNTSPLVQYKNLLYGQDTEFVNLKKMACVGPLYGEYGSWLIRKHPIAFVHYFVGPNAIRYLYPPMEAFASLPPFFLRPDYLGKAATNWFGVRTLTASRSAINLRTSILWPYQTMMMFIHVLFLITLIGFSILKGIKTLTRSEKYTLCVLVALWVFDLAFNLTAAATVMRYQIFPMIIEISLILWLTERIYTRGTNKRPAMQHRAGITSTETRSICERALIACRVLSGMN